MQLLAFLNQVRAGIDEFHQFCSGKIGDAIANDDPLVLFGREPSHDRCLAHAAIIVAWLRAFMRPCNADRVAAEVAAVAINAIRWNAERLKQRIDEEIDAAACHVQLDALFTAEVHELLEP